MRSKSENSRSVATKVLMPMLLGTPVPTMQPSSTENFASPPTTRQPERSRPLKSSSQPSSPAPCADSAASAAASRISFALPIAFPFQYIFSYSPRPTRLSEWKPARLAR